MQTMKVVQITIGRFHHFHLAQRLHTRGLLEAVYTGYPRWKLRDTGLPPEVLRTFPWLQVPYMLRLRLPLATPWLNREWEWWAHKTLDAYAARTMPACDVLIALSGSGLVAGRRVRELGGVYVCDRGSSHILHQQDLLEEEHRRWDLAWSGTDPRKVSRELEEYEEADAITVPSSFAYESFIARGVPAAKLRQVSYGANLARFQPAGGPAGDGFTVLFVGQISLRKGVQYLLEAFARLRYPGKKLRLIGTLDEGFKTLLGRFDLTGVEFLGRVPNDELAAYYSSAHVFVLPSIEEGLSMVMGEAMACGCPVIGTENTGAADLFADGKAGYVVPIRSGAALTEKMELIAGNADLRARLSEAALTSVKAIRGWDHYGAAMTNCLQDLVESRLGQRTQATTQNEAGLA